MGVSINTRKAYSEIDEFLGLLSEEQRNKIPKKLRPKRITIKPETIFTKVWYSLRKLPKVPAKAPRETKTIVKPKTNPRAQVSVFFVFFVLPPAK